ncbi:GTPase-activating protein and VPS9 domain-containing protein 1-like isoform X3 [Apostichopus japonicus]|uniref:GTPase-activating protein and VPS9 domain-containing protein 1-like isoform X3 n=1 Tax=Stichopus japonicus TaxID=307972 RepID=UPI003AB65D46
MEEPDSKVDLVDLAHKLKEVRLFAKSERQLLQSLFTENTEIADKIFQTAWITRQQRHILKKLIVASPDAPPSVCCYGANALEMVNFIDSYKQLNFQDTLYGEFLAHLREHPRTIAVCLSLGELQDPRESQKTAGTIISSVCGNCIGPGDEHRTLLLLQSLIVHQVAESTNPRRLLLKGTCSFCAAFKHFTESLFSSKLYLTAALHDPIMAVLMDDEYSLETDPEKVALQFTQEERLQLFGPADTEQYRKKLQAHLQSVTSQLVALCENFINGLLSNLFCFPQGLEWIISELHKILMKKGKTSPSEVRAMCADLLFNWFICPAIVDPEPLGIISDILVSENARFNLMQIAKILQQLAHDTNVSGDGNRRDSDILNRFSKKNGMSSLLDSLMNNMKMEDSPPAVSEVSGLVQNAALITETDLHGLVAYFREVVSNNPDRTELKDLEACLSPLPPSAPLVKTVQSPPIQIPNENRNSVTSPTAFRNSVVAKVSSVTKKGRKTASDVGDLEVDFIDGQLFDPMSQWQQEDVLVVSLGNHTIECPGMLPESKVLASMSNKKNLPEVTTNIPQTAVSSIPEKHLRFSDPSGNSDNMMEAMSIGASNSVYSMDMETDIVSNLSGRNTPRSAISMASSTTEHQRPEIIDSTQLPNSTNITDQFGKFEIEKQNCDMDKERVMNPEIYSETWSTDVIGSDTSEPPSEANPIEHLTEIAEIQDEEPDVSSAGATAVLDIQHADMAETGSETWSVDVLQDDSELDRLREVEDVTPSEGAPTAEGSVEEGEACRGSEGQSSRRSSTSIDRSSSTDMEDSKKEVVNGDKGRSWIKKKIRQIKSATSKGNKVNELDLDQRSDDLQVILNPALVKNGFLDGSEMKASSVPSNSGEDILRKYRGLRRTQSSELLEDGLQPDSSADENSSHSDRPDSTAAEPDSSDLELSSNDGSFAFNDAKRKLQIVLRSADLSSMPWLSGFKEDMAHRELFTSGVQYPQNKLLAFLKALQAEAVNLQDRSLIAQLWETLRCVQIMDNNSCKKLLNLLKEDHQRSSVYIAYLIRCRKGLTTTKAYLTRQLERIQRDKEVVNKFFTMVCVRLFLERQEESILKFISDFKQLTAADEKTQLVKHFLYTLNDWIQEDPIWAAASEVQKIDAEIATERAIMTTVYKLALYPNGDGDIHRDQLLHNHIEKLSKVVTANHKNLRIPEKYQRELPWPAAQAEILNINVYKTPKDKVLCVVRCCSIIMNLLSLANEVGGPPGADAFVPVLMFVLIKANPPSLLSTVQYVNSFYIQNDSYRAGDDENKGEETYWWTQFEAAIEFTKTMDYKK